MGCSYCGPQRQPVQASYHRTDPLRISCLFGFESYTACCIYYSAKSGLSHLGNEMIADHHRRHSVDKKTVRIILGRCAQPLGPVGYLHARIVHNDIDPVTKPVYLFKHFLYALQVRQFRFHCDALRTEFFYLCLYFISMFFLSALNYDVASLLFPNVRFRMFLFIFSFVCVHSFIREIHIFLKFLPDRSDFAYSHARMHGVRFARFSVYPV